MQKSILVFCTDVPICLGRCKIQVTLSQSFRIMPKTSYTEVKCSFFVLDLCFSQLKFYFNILKHPEFYSFFPVVLMKITRTKGVILRGTGLVGDFTFKNVRKSINFS